MRVRGYAASTPCWYEFVAVDAPSAAVFYQDLLGWELIDTVVGQAFTRNGRAVAGLRQSPDGPPAGWMVYIATDDADVTLESLVAAGGTVLLPPTTVSDRGRLALCRDIEGATFGLWQRDRFGGAELINEPSTVCWSELTGRDEKAAVAFYGTTFGWTERAGEIAEGLDYIEWVCGGRVVAGLTLMDERFPAEVPPHWRLTLLVEDCTAAVARCVELGGTAVFGPKDVVVGDYAQLVDPQGGTFGVIQLLPELLEAL
jgi:uncharacterized protein